MAQIKNPLKDKMNDDELDLSICNYVDKDVPVKDIVSMPILCLMDEKPSLESKMLAKLEGKVQVKRPDTIDSTKMWHHSNISMMSKLSISENP